MVMALASHEADTYAATKDIVRLGFYMGYAPPGTSPLEPIAMAQEAERLGYDSAWAAEAWGTDCVTVLSWLGATTERIKLGSAIMQIPGRTPSNTAMTAATLDLLSEGRFLLGLGTSGPQVVEGWHGQPWHKPLTWLREYITIVKKILARDQPLAQLVRGQVGGPAAGLQPVGQPVPTRRLGVVAGQRATALGPRDPHRRGAGQDDAEGGRLDVQVVQDRHREDPAAQLDFGRYVHPSTVPRQRLLERAKRVTPHGEKGGLRLLTGSTQRLR
jgi:alkanesulfonate monooxygenase SsuD/methylene tetrahydromethanopterin reductase-like flavin-dependent oxidoreductase (luciferase family)